MLFNIEVDHGHVVTGYFVPDRFTGTSVIRIEGSGIEPLTFECNETRQSLVMAGRHETGWCGFRLDQDLIPGLAEMQDLELYDPETGVVLYRRRPAESIIKQKLFRLETHLEPLSRLDDALDGSFRFFYKGMEQFGRETTTQIFLLDHADSIYASGRLLYKQYEYFLEDRGFRPICLLRNPYDELAERLLILSRAGNGDADMLGARDSMSLEAAIEFAASIDLSDEKQLRRAFRTMSAEDAFTFADPLVRALGARTPDETPQDSTMAGALEVLSNCAVVGLREYPNLFLEGLGAQLGLEAKKLPPVQEPPEVLRLGQILRDIKPVKSLIEHDLELYDHVRAAMEKAL
ncbi:hypothetical protein FHP25_13530 [Vineibacter terrae]|uniref:Uncharacterized protein n=1 Tax=Vineibacter terrae TaxID=2586908 RepID=A0A5C8PML4_9HYPH|nr:hypothetical protein [Vineibacter terrae]TXL75669.1 hypothetical protein FHP25_13530 [Vineibacter terrae]